MKKTSTRNHLLIHILLIAGIAVTVFPFLWMVFTSFKTLPESMQKMCIRDSLQCDHLPIANDSQ